MLAFLLAISIKDIIRGPNGGLILVILGAQGGPKLRNYLKKVKALLQIKNNCIKVVFINHIMITCPYDLDPLTPHIYIVKLGFTGVYIIFTFLL